MFVTASVESCAAAAAAVATVLLQDAATKSDFYLDLQTLKAV
jgi:hypothetical protein